MTTPLWPVSVKGVLQEDGRVLLVRNDRGEWELPGGRLELGERPVECVIRELREETALDIRCGELLLTDTFEVLPGRPVLIVAYACSAAPGQPVTISDEHLDFGWFPVSGLPAEDLPEVYRRAILANTSG